MENDKENDYFVGDYDNISKKNVYTKAKIEQININIDEFKFLNERQKEVYKLRKEGKTYTEIANKFCVTPTIIRSNYLNAEWKIKEYYSNDKNSRLLKNIYFDENNYRIQNTFSYINLNTINDLLSVTSSDLLKNRNFGKRSLFTVISKLQELGIDLQEHNIIKGASFSDNPLKNKLIKKLNLKHRSELEFIETLNNEELKKYYENNYKE